MGNHSKDKSKKKAKELPAARMPPRDLGPLAPIRGSAAVPPVLPDVPPAPPRAPGPVIPNPSQASATQDPVNHGEHHEPPEPEGQNGGDKRLADDTGNEGRERKRRRKKLDKILECMENDYKTKRANIFIDKYHKEARSAARMVHPFMSPIQALSFGMQHEGSVNESADESSESDSDSDDGSTASNREAINAAYARRLQKAHARELIAQYRGLLKFIPDLRGDLGLLDEDELVTVSDYIKHNIKHTRSNDSARLLDNVMTFIQDSDLSLENKEYENAPGAKFEKFSRGWHNWHTARLICPQAKLAIFDADWLSFADQVMHHNLNIGRGYYPVFLYDQRLVDADDELAGILMSNYFLMCFRALWTGPGSAKLPFGRAERMPGKPPIAFAYKIFEVTPRMLAYTAVLVRGALSSQTDFSENDFGLYDACDLFDHIVELFEDPASDWSQNTLKWWNQRVFGRISHIWMAGEAPEEETPADRLRKARRVQRKAARVAARNAPAPTRSSPPTID